MRRRTTYFWLGLSAILLSCLIGLLAMPLWPLRQHQAARERWQHHRPGHYTYRVVGVISWGTIISGGSRYVKGRSCRRLTC